MNLEKAMLSDTETPIAVYFATWHPDLQTILDDITDGSMTDEKSHSAAEAIFNSISASGYQVVVASGQPMVRNDAKIAILHGKLTGTGAEEKLPTIAIVTHYDSASVAPVSEIGFTKFYLY